MIWRVTELKEQSQPRTRISSDKQFVRLPTTYLTIGSQAFESTILRAINDLKELGYINPEHSKIKGE